MPKNMTLSIPVRWGYIRFKWRLIVAEKEVCSAWTKRSFLKRLIKAEEDLYV